MDISKTPVANRSVILLYHLANPYCEKMHMAYCLHKYVLAFRLNIFGFIWFALW